MTYNCTFLYFLSFSEMKMFQEIILGGKIVLYCMQKCEAVQIYLLAENLEQS